MTVSKTRMGQTRYTKFMTLPHLGEYTMPQARQNAIQNMIPSPVPVFWNVTKED